MNNIKITGSLGTIYQHKSSTCDALLQMESLDVSEVIESLLQLDSKDDAFNDAVKLIHSKLYNMLFKLEADVYIDKDFYKNT